MTNLFVTLRLLMALHGAEADFRMSPPDGDHGTAWGPYQIRPCVVADVNRMYGRKFVHSDARDYYKARLICILYLQGYGKEYQRRTGRTPDEKTLARIWNGGPSGWRKSKTLQYWEHRVKPNMKGSKS